MAWRPYIYDCFILYIYVYQLFFALLQVWDLEADKLRDEYIPAPDVAVRSISTVCAYVKNI